MSKTIAMDWRKEMMEEALKVAEKNAQDAKEELIESWKRTLSQGRIEDQSLSPYGRTQRYRRKKEGLQTAKKDLQFSGTLVNSLEETEKFITDQGVDIHIGFKGDAYRRRDQSKITNKELADYLSTQQRGGEPILKIPTHERRRIEEKYNVKIT